MSQYCYLSIKKQEGKLEVDTDALAKSKVLKDAEAELFEQHGEPEYNGEHIFNLVKGRLKLYNGGYDSAWEMSDTVNIWGYDAKSLLKVLAKCMKQGKVSFFEEPEGSRPTVWVVEPGKVTQG